MSADRNEAIMVFVLGLLGLVFCAVLAPVAWVKGNSYVSTCQAVGQQPDGLGVAGRIMGIVGTIALGLGVIAMLFAFCAGAGTYAWGQ